MDTDRQADANTKTYTTENLSVETFGQQNRFSLVVLQKTDLTTGKRPHRSHRG